MRYNRGYVSHGDTEETEEAGQAHLYTEVYFRVISVFRVSPSVIDREKLTNNGKRVNT